MGEVVNLNRVRKARDKLAAAAAARENRARHGRTGAQKTTDRVTLSRDEKALDGKQITEPAPYNGPP